MKVVFDIETVRRYKHLVDAPEAEQAAWEYTSKKKYPDMALSDSYEQWAGLYPEFGKIVVISALANTEKGLVRRFTGMEFGGANAEATLLKNFEEWLTNGGVTKLIGQYIKGFDIPYIVTRMLAHNMRPPHFFLMYGQKPWELNHLVCTQEIWKGGQYKTCNSASLINICLILGVESPKDGIQGSEVSEVYHSGEPDALDRIGDYCDKDVVASAKVFQRLKELQMYP